MSNDEKWRTFWVAALGLGAISVVILMSLLWFFAHTFRLNISGDTLQSLSKLVTVGKKVGSDLVVVKQPSRSSSNRRLPSGYLLAYEQNPEGFEADARLFDMWTTAIKLSTSVVGNGPSGTWVKNSSELTNLPTKDRIDPWGHTVCVLRRSDMVLVISGGAGAPSSPTCKDIRMTSEELEKFPNKKLLQSSTGSLVLVYSQGPINDAFRPAK